LFFTLLNLHAQVDICVRVQNDSMIVAYKAQKEYTSAPVNLWNSQTVTVRYPKTITLTWGGLTQLSAFSWEQDPQTLGAGKDGNDGYWYKSFFSANTPTENLTQGTFKEVFKIKITSSQAVVLEGINNAITQQYHLDAAVNNAIESGLNGDGNVFAAYINSCGTVAPPPPPTDLDGDLFTGAADSDEGDPCNPSKSAPTCDFDGDAMVNSLDNDDDNDGVLDALDPNPYSNKDTDGDGLSDDYETVVVKTNPTNPDTDADNIKDGVEWKGSDNQHTTLADNTNPLDPCDPANVVIGEVKVIKPSTCVVADAQITISATGSPSLAYSIDNGKTFNPNPYFHNLKTGDYQVAVKNNLGCQKSYTKTTSIACDTCFDNLPPVFKFTNPIAKDKENGDTITMQCGYEEILVDGRDFFVTDNVTQNIKSTFHETLLTNSNSCEKGYLVQVYCTWEAVDACGNLTKIGFYMNVKDTIAPTLVGIPSHIEITDQDVIPTQPIVTAKDACSNDPIAVQFTQTITDTLIVRIWSAKDNCGNLKTAIQNIRIKKTTIVVPPPAPPAAPPVTSDLMEIRLNVGEFQNIILTSNDFSKVERVAILDADTTNMDIAKIEFYNNERKLMNVLGEKAGTRNVLIGRYNALQKCDSLWLKINIEDHRDTTVHVYSAFSPNNDNLNDFFTIKNIELFKPNILTIYNRFGNKVYSANDYQNDWNGTFKEQRLPEGTYFYTLELPNKQFRKGYVQLER
jgi:gliding motility-associated-like protein